MSMENEDLSSECATKIFYLLIFYLRFLVKIATATRHDRAKVKETLWKRHMKRSMTLHFYWVLYLCLHKRGESMDRSRQHAGWFKPYFLQN